MSAAVRSGPANQTPLSAQSSSRDPEQWLGSAEQIALHALRTLERVFALGLCHMPRSKAAKEQKWQFLQEKRRAMQ
jgi:hypothetical protein